MKTNENENPPNRLIDATSPYLLQHAHNPVQWQPWDEKALEQARREDKPIFLSIGYSACHWCHVMEREVFENREIAAIMNEHFVNIKVDREERPDLDELYMLATQLMSGSGGWPMSVWLTPELKPFYAGTYFPPVDGFGRPGFPKVELALVEAWQARRGEVLQQAQKVVEAIRQHADETGGQGAGERLDILRALGLAVEHFADKFDAEHGGLGSAPKFPPHQALHLWLSILRHPGTAALSANAIEMVREMTRKTLDGMMRGGIYDHVGGGFARYSTDAKWLVPHFEKMLYDNAQLAAAYAVAAVVFHRGDYARVARETLDFWLREMTGHEGTSLRAGTTAGFYSTLDADSEGHEGKYYVWTAEQIREALPEGDDATVVMQHFGITEHGNWEESPVPRGTVLSLATEIRARSVSKGRQEAPVAKEADRERIEKLVHKLRAVRAQRVPPHLDDKILTSWNGLMISALAIASRLLHEPRYLEAAHRGMGFLLTHHVRGKELLRVSRHGAAHTGGFLEDHAFLLNGLMDLVDSTAATSLPGTMARKRALELADALIAKFADDEHGGFFFTPKDGDQLFARMKNAADNATPSANGMAIRALLRLARVSGKEKYRDVAMKAVAAFAANIHRRPDYFPTILQSLLEDADAAAHHVVAGASAPVVEEGTLLPLEPARNQAALLELSGEPDVTAAENAFEVVLTLTIADGFHVQSNRPTDGERFATVARLRGELPLVSQAWEYPADSAEGYSGRVIFRVQGELPQETGAGMYTFRATVLAQPCNDVSCLAPEKVSFDFRVRKE